jgi:polyisoprenoid-binding protein YceI
MIVAGRHGRTLAALLLSSAAIAAVAAEAPGEWRVASGDVRVHCPLTIGGSFEAETSALSGTLNIASTRPVALAGTLSVDLRALDTGIEMRNGHMRERYLEVEKGEGFAKAVLSDIRLLDAQQASFEGTTAFTGTLSLHGTSRAVSGHARLRREGAALQVEASFPVRIPEYGIEKPRYLGVGVKDEVQVKVSFGATPAPAAGGPQ